MKRKRVNNVWPSIIAGIWTPGFFEQFSRPWFEFSGKVRVTKSNPSNLLKEIGLKKRFNNLPSIIVIFSNCHQKCIIIMSSINSWSTSLSEFPKKHINWWDIYCEFNRRMVIFQTPGQINCYTFCQAERGLRVNIGTFLPYIWLR